MCVETEIKSAQYNLETIGNGAYLFSNDGATQPTL